jgi:hypothetical protein
VKVPASLPLRGRASNAISVAPARERARTRTCSRKPNKACHGGHEVSRHSFPAFLQLSSRTVWTSVHHEIRDPKALCASKNGASKAHSLGALLNSDSATRRSAESSPKDTQTRDQRREYWVPRSSRGMTLEDVDESPTPPHHSPLRGRARICLQAAKRTKAKSPARERTQARTRLRKPIKAREQTAARTCGRKTKTPAPAEDKQLF